MVDTRNNLCQSSGMDKTIKQAYAESVFDTTGLPADTTLLEYVQAQLDDGISLRECETLVNARMPHGLKVSRMSLARWYTEQTVHA
jgi:hypothetical protein